MNLMNAELKDFTVVSGDMAGYAVSKKGQIYSLVDDSIIKPYCDEIGAYVYSLNDPLKKVYVKDVLYKLFVHSKIPDNLQVGLIDNDVHNLDVANLKLTAKVDQPVSKTTKRGRGSSFSIEKVARIIQMYNESLDTTDKSQSAIIQEIADKVSISTPTIRAMILGNSPYKYVKYDKKSQYAYVIDLETLVTDTSLTSHKSLTVDDIVIINNKKSKNHNRIAKVTGFDRRRHLISVTVDGKTAITVRKDCLRKCRKKV